MDETKGTQKGRLAKAFASRQVQIVVAATVALLAICLYFGMSGIKQPQTVTAYGNDDTAKRIAEILSDMENVGACNVMITYEQESADVTNRADRVAGVVVVAQGGNDIRVKLRIIDAVCALLDVDGSRIRVYQMK